MFRMFIRAKYPLKKIVCKSIFQQETRIRGVPPRGGRVNVFGEKIKVEKKAIVTFVSYHTEDRATRVLLVRTRYARYSPSRAYLYEFNVLGLYSGSARRVEILRFSSSDTRV